jgi:hypothetical protein
MVSQIPGARFVVVKIMATAVMGRGSTGGTMKRMDAEDISVATGAPRHGGALPAAVTELLTATAPTSEGPAAPAGQETPTDQGTTSPRRKSFFYKAKMAPLPASNSKSAKKVSFADPLCSFFGDSKTFSTSPTSELLPHDEAFFSETPGS